MSETVSSNVMHAPLYPPPAHSLCWTRTHAHTHTHTQTRVGQSLAHTLTISINTRSRRAHVVLSVLK